MRLLRWGERGAERPGMAAPDGTLRDLTGIVPDIAGAVLSDEGLGRLRALDPAALPPVPEGARLGACVGGTTKFVCIGLNYADHAAESGLAVPSEPVIFLKANSAICGPFDPILIPRGSVKTDWEVELAVVIGRPAKYVPEAEAMAHVAGYAVANDVSEREFQIERQGQVYGVAHLVSYASRFFTLHPGDVISTGTPPGVGMGMRPPRYLKAGEVVTLGIEGLGEQRQVCVQD